MMDTLSSGGSVTPSGFDTNGTVNRRSTDVLVSIPPSGVNAERYFAWPVWAKYTDDTSGTGTISLFDGSKVLEEGDITLQVRLNDTEFPSVSGISLMMGYNVSAAVRNPASLGSGRSGGLWLVNTTPAAVPLFYLVPEFIAAAEKTPLTIADNPLFNYEFTMAGDGIHNGMTVDFLIKLDGLTDPNLFVARLDAPAGANVAGLNWWTMIRPFTFQIQNARMQRGGVTILNNVINSNNREETIIRYNILRPGRVTIQVYTMDGTVVKSIRRNEQREAGEWSETWDGTNNNGRPVARGMYFIRIVGPDIDEIRRVMVIR
jgi:hypothetical protein